MTPNLKWLALRVFRQRFGVEILRSRKNPNLMDFIENRGINLVLEQHPNRLNRSGDSRIGVDLIQASAGLEAGRDGRTAFHGSPQTCVGRDC